MGLFTRRQKSPTGGAQQQPLRLSSDRLAWLPGRVEVQVAGESFHEDAIAAADERGSPDSPLAAVLVPEPGNAHDSCAVAVYVAGEHVGFLPREVARQVQPAIVAFSRAYGGRFVSCPAEIRWHEVGPQVVLLLDPKPLGLRPEVFEAVPDMAAAIGRLLTRLDEPAPYLTGADQQARSALMVAEQDRAETEGNYDREPGDWPRVERAFRRLVSQLAKAHDPWVSAAWLGVGRATRYQRGRRDDALMALVEALYWGRSNSDAWWELIDLASAAPHVPTLLALFARIPFEVRPGVLDALLSMSHGHDRMGRLGQAAGERLREELLHLAEYQDDKGTIATLAGNAGLAAEKAGDLQAAVTWWRRAVAAGGTDEKVADRLTVWLVKQHEFGEAMPVLQHALAAAPHSAEVTDRLQRRLARCERNIAE
jgi:tetratricopeptide (TPR) repeat protein